MRLRFDQLGKQIGQQALGPSGTTVAHDEISPDAQHADLRHEPDPAREAERARLGLLGRLASVPCLVEIYSHPPDKDEVLACASKLIAFRQRRLRAFRRARARSRGRSKETFVEPFLWIISAGRPSAVLSELAATEATGWPAGVYFAPPLFLMAIVVASELPQERSTLLVRLMAAGPLLARAIEELAALPARAHERVVATQTLLDLQHALGRKPSPTAEEREFIVTMHDAWEKAQEKVREEGLNEGRAEAAARAVLTALRVRGLAVPEAMRERILAQKDPERLERWLERAIVAASLAEVLDDPS
jgi:hypothetical protein